MFYKLGNKQHEKCKVYLHNPICNASMTAMAHESLNDHSHGGNCEACKQKIEQSLKLEGITKAEGDAKAHLLIATYDTHKMKKR